MKASWLAVLGLGIAVPSAMGCGHHGGWYRHRAELRTCYANQKTLVGAVEMWNLENNAQADLAVLQGLDWRTGTAHLPEDSSGVARAVVIPAEFLETLRKEGYLQSVPRDPGRAGSRYLFVSWENGFFCTEHGGIRVDGTPEPARQQLVEAGITDPALLAMAREVLPGERFDEKVEAFVAGLAEIFPLLLLMMIGFFAGIARSSHVLAGEMEVHGRRILRSFLAMMVLGALSVVVFPPLSALAAFPAIVFFVVAGYTVGTASQLALRGGWHLLRASPPVHFAIRLDKHIG